MPADDVSGVALVQRRGSIVVESVHGVADAGSGLACTRDTRFQICSVSKQFTAATVLLLADRKRVSLDDRIERWFSDCPRDWEAITLHHLLTHTSGLGHWPDFPDLDLNRPARRERLGRPRAVRPGRPAPGRGVLHV
jgi:CubicO group peptidase (beta-lactamase class C family)